jgi:heme/copper-type cytochrome/quinol oxidase subunit 3
MAGHFSTDRHDPLRAGAVFWQYTNVVWFLVVTALFLVSRHG